MKSFSISTCVRYALLLLVAIGCAKDEKKIICYPTTIISSSTGSGGSSSTTIVLTYNSSNQVTLMVDGGDSYTFTYDSKGNAIQKTSSCCGNTANSFDSNNRLTLSITASGSDTYTITYAYNSTGQLTSRTYTYSFSSLVFTDTFSYPNTSSKNYTTITYSCSGGCSGSYLETFEWDNKPNPRKNIAALFPSTQPDNNPTKVTGGDGTIRMYTYQYNSNGFPTSSAWVCTGSNCGDTSGTDTVTYDCK